MSATSLDLSAIQTDATDYAEAFRAIIGVLSSDEVAALIDAIPEVDLSPYATVSYVDSGLATKQNSIGYTPANKAGDTFGGPVGSSYSIGYNVGLFQGPNGTHIYMDQYGQFAFKDGVANRSFLGISGTDVHVPYDAAFGFSGGNVFGPVDAKIVRGSTGPTVDVCALGGMRVRNLANDAFFDLAARDGYFRNATTSGTIYANDLRAASIYVVNGLGFQVGFIAPNTPYFAADQQIVTGSNTTEMLAIRGTWNTSGAPTAIKLNVTDTASASNSLLLDLRVGGVSKARVAKSGASAFSDVVTCSAAGAPYWGGRFQGANGGGIGLDGGGNLTLLAANGGPAVWLSGYSANVWSTFIFKWGNKVWDGSELSVVTADLGIARNAEGTLEINNGTAGQYRDLIARSSTFSGLVACGTYTVATLPSASANAGKEAQVTDSSVASSGNFGATVTGGGAHRVKVFSDGTNWVIN